jgi:hypothetical protein
VKDVKQLLGLGHYQNRPYWAAVTHLPLVYLAYAPAYASSAVVHKAKGYVTRLPICRPLLLRITSGISSGKT